MSWELVIGVFEAPALKTTYGEPQTGVVAVARWRRGLGEFVGVNLYWILEIFLYYF